MDLLSVVDRWGRTVVLTESAWSHILAEHAEMWGQEDALDATVAAPELVMDDIEVPERIAFCRSGVLQGRYREWYLKVVVHLSPPDEAGTIVGESDGLPDPGAEAGRNAAMAIVRDYAPKLNLQQLRRIDPRQVVVSYDRASDTLMIHLFGRGRPAVSVPSPANVDRDLVFFRGDPETEELVGFQIEDFLRLYVPVTPRALDWLHPQRGAELRGLTAADVDRIRDRDGLGGQAPATVDALLQDLAPNIVGV